MDENQAFYLKTLLELKQLLAGHPHLPGLRADVDAEIELLEIESNEVVEPIAEEDL